MLRRMYAVAIAVLTALALGSCAGASSADQQTTPPHQDSHTPHTTGSPGAVASPSSTDAPPSSGSALSAKLLTGPVAGVTLQEIDRIELPHDIGSVFGHCGDCEIDPPECLTTGLSSPDAASQTDGDAVATTVMLGSATSSPEKHREYAQHCPSASGTASSAPFTMNVKLLPEPDIAGVSDIVVTASTWHYDGETPPENEPWLIVVSGNVGDINVVVRTRSASDDQGSPSADVATEIFKAQVEQLNS